MDLDKIVGITIHQVLRYASGGLTLYAVAWLLAKQELKDLTKDVASIPLSFAVFVVGGMVYVLYRVTIGESVGAKMLHGLIHVGRKDRCKYCHFSREFEVTPGLEINSFRLVRERLFDRRLREQFHREHSELHLVFLPSSVLIVASLLLELHGYFWIGLLWLFVLGCCRCDCQHPKWAAILSAAVFFVLPVLIMVVVACCYGLPFSARGTWMIIAGFIAFFFCLLGDRSLALREFDYLSSLTAEDTSERKKVEQTLADAHLIVKREEQS